MYFIKDYVSKLFIDPSTTPPAAPSTFIKDDNVSSTVTLPDGRKLGYAEYGSRTGRPILLMHGLACSRHDGLYFHETAQQLNARIIGIDRPGMGLSTAQPTRTLQSFAKDVEHLTDHLKLDSYAAMGQSGGGPSVLACAKYLPADKLKAAAMIIALGPPDIGMSGARFVNRLGFPYGFRYCPSFLNRWFWRWEGIGRVDLSDEQRMSNILQQVENAKASIPAIELPVVSNPAFHRCGLASTREGFAQGYDGVLTDGRLCCLDFGFKVEEIRPELPIFLWYGKQDVLVPPNHGVQLEKRLGSRAELHLVDETHASLPWHRKEEIIKRLLEKM